MKVKILRSTIADGKDLLEGKIYEIPDSEAKILIQLNKAVVVEEEDKTTEKKKGK